MQNNANDISITILETPDDIKQSISPESSSKTKRKKYWHSRLLTAAMILFYAVIICTAAVAALYAIEGTASMAVLYLLNTVVFILILVLIGKQRKKNQIKVRESTEKARMAEYSKGFFPVNYRFTDDEIILSTASRTAKARYSDIYEVSEFAEGLSVYFTAPFFAYNIWLPARFISKADACRLTSLLKEKAGRKYSTVAQINSPETARIAANEPEIRPQGEKLMTITAEYDKAKVIKDIVSGIFSRTKMLWISLILYFIFFTVNGFFRDISKTVRLIVKIVRLAAKYTELGQVISQADLIDTAQSLLTTFAGILISVIILIAMIRTAAIIVSRISYTISEYVSAKAVIKSEKTVCIYDDAIVSTSSDTRYVMPWSDVQKAVQKGSRVNIYDSSKGIIIPVSSMEKEQKNQLFDMLTARLSKSWQRPQAALTASENAIYKADTYSTNAE